MKTTLLWIAAIVLAAAISGNAQAVFNQINSLWGVGSITLCNIPGANQTGICSTDKGVAIAPPSGQYSLIVTQASLPGLIPPATVPSLLTCVYKVLSANPDNTLNVTLACK